MSLGGGVAPELIVATPSASLPGSRAPEGAIALCVASDVGRRRGAAHRGAYRRRAWLLLGQYLEEVVARDVFVEVDAAGVDLDAFARPRRSLSARVVDLAVDLEQAVVLGACRGGGVDDEGHPAAAEVRR